MRVFVVGTGRCGTMTFAKACSHITNYTSGHESHAGTLRTDFPDNHIEVDAHLYHYLSLLLQKYPRACYVHLVRDREACVQSLAKRASFQWWAKFAFQIKDDKADQRKLAELFYDNTNNTIEQLLKPHNSMRFTITESSSVMPKILWSIFWKSIGAEGDHDKALEEFSIRHNASKER